MTTRFMQPEVSHPSPWTGLILALLLVSGVIVSLILRSLVTPPPVTNPFVDRDFGNLPFSFTPNAGQTDPAVQFQGHGAGATMFFRSNEVVFSLQSIDQAEASNLRLRFDGANPATEITGSGNLPGMVNYIVGNDPAAWHTNLPTFESIIYHQLYPGIDLRYDGQQGTLKSTYTLAPGANPHLIRWHYQHATALRVDPASGNLLITLAAGQPELIETAPYAWQDINGQRIPVNVRYLLDNDGRVGFTLGAYDPAYPLVIDPTLVYSSYLGGNGLDEAEAIAIDSAGNVYVTGGTSSSNFPGNPIRSRSGGEDIFVAKINPAGTAFVYTTYLGGSRDESDPDSEGDEVESSNSIAVDSNGNVYITGATDAIDFPTTSGVVQPSRNGALFTDEAFVTKLAPDGTLSYSTYLGGNLSDEGEGIAVDSTGHAYVVGSTASTNFPTRNPLQGSFNGNLDAFLIKLDPNATSLVYGTYLGGSNSDDGDDIAIDSAGNAYIVGATASSNFPTSANIPQSSNNGATDVFIAKINAAGNSLIYSTYLGGSQNDNGYGIALDSAGNAYVTGSTSSTNFPTMNPFQARSGGCTSTTVPCDAFVAKLNPTGNSLVYSTYLGGSASDDGSAIAVNNANEAYIIGSTTSSNFPTQDSLQSYSGGSDAFVTRLNASGTAAIYSTYLGGNSIEFGNSIEVDDTGNAYITGGTISSNFPLVNPLQGTTGGNSDAFVAKIGNTGSNPPIPTDTPVPPPNPTPLPTTTPAPNPNDPTTPRLAGSYKTPALSVLLPGETLTYQIVLYNNGTAEANATVTDQLPAEVEYVPGTATNGGTYDAATHQLTWNSVQVPAGTQVFLTYAVTSAVDVRVPTTAINTATINSGNEVLTRVAVIILLPSTSPDDPLDQTAPDVQSLTIGDQDIVSPGEMTTLTIAASDDESISEMYLREWYLETTAFATRWRVGATSGWVAYDETYEWQIGSEPGIHYVGVWVKDGAGNISLLNEKSIDFVSVIQDGTEVPQNRALLYAIYYPADTAVTAELTTSSGDADLYVWYPGNFLAPNQSSTNTGTNPDGVNFTTTRAGTYLFMVFGFAESTFDLSISPAGGPRIPTAAQAQSAPAQATRPQRAVASDKGGPNLAALLVQTGLDPLGSSVAGIPGSDAVYIPLLVR